jgi:hypothetical protein
VVAAPSGISNSAGPVIELQIEALRHRPFGMLAGRDEAELRWLATVLRQALRLANEQGAGPGWRNGAQNKLAEKPPSTGIAAPVT